MTTTTDLQHKAELAWARLLACGDPCPSVYIGMALDWVCDDTTDDREAAKLALYGAAADWLSEPNMPHGETPSGTHTGDCIHSTRLGRFKDAEDARSCLRVNCESPGFEESPYFPWMECAGQALSLCRAIQAA